MRSFAAPFAILFSAVCASVTESTAVTIQLTKLGSNTPTKSKRINRARTELFQGSPPPTTVPATNWANVYLVSVGVGHDAATYHNLMVDTGSSNTWCGATTPYKQTSTSVPTGETLNMTYGGGPGGSKVFGYEYLDELTLGSNLVVANQSIGVAQSSNGFAPYHVDGVLGLGPVDLTVNTLSPDRNSTVPTVMDNLVLQGRIEMSIFSIYFAPTPDDNHVQNGVLTFGGIDTNLYEGELTYIPVTQTHPSSTAWGINITTCAYGSNTVVPGSTAGIIDTGTSAIMLADDFFKTYMDAIPGSKVDSNSSLLEIPPSAIEQMHPLDFLIGDRIFTMTTAAQLIPESQNTAWGGIPGKRYGTVTNMGKNSGQGLDFILGMVFLERYYTVFDNDAHRVGFAQTQHTFVP